ncbi:MAG: hypothetical protein Q8O67_22800 [Deltaproteobacteria bacterium]|nr:hypothetical protein [Deltaproteobacteria bacterium]
MKVSFRLFALPVALAAACAEPAPQAGGPRIDALSKDAIRVGETLHVSGRGFLNPTEGETRIEFVGVFYWTDDEGRTIAEDVPSFAIAPIFDGQFPEGGTVGDMEVPAGASVLRWNRFGPYVAPFGGNGRQVGLFKGTVSAINTTLEGVESRGEPTDIALEIKPSVLITRLEPVLGSDDDGNVRSADCGKPALRAFGGVPYVLEVETMGFTPKYFLYEIADINGSNQFTSFTHTAAGNVDRLGDPVFGAGEMIVFNQLPDDVDYALAGIRVTAVDADDNAIATAMPIPVVRPVRMQYDGNRKLAEYYQPVPVHGPIVGGIGTEVTYAESTSESRQNAVSVTFSQSTAQSAGTEAVKDWSEGYGIERENSSTESTEASTSESATSSETYGTEYSTSEETSVQLGSETGTEWGWNVVDGTSQEQFSEEMNHLYGTVSGSIETQVGGEASIPGLGGVSGHVGTTVGTAVEAGRENTSGERTGVTSERGSSMGTSENSSEVFGSTTTDGTSQNVSGTYGVERQSSINTARSQTNATNESLTYDMGGSASVSSGYEVGSETAWEQSWVSTSEQENLLSFSGKIPNGRCAMIYRQTVRYVRTAQMYSYDMCGVRSSMGELTFNEWSWSPNIAIGDDCEENLPESTQPKAQCFEACE